MQLTSSDAALFFKLMPAVQAYANRQLHIIKDVETPEQYQKITNERRVKLRMLSIKNPRSLVILFERIHLAFQLTNLLLFLAGRIMWQVTFSLIEY